MSESVNSNKSSKKISRRTLLKGAGALGLTGITGLMAACAAPPAPTAPTAPAAPAASGESQPAEAPAPASGASKITWFMNIDEARNKWAKDVIMPAFAKENPDIALELLTVPWEEHDTKLIALNAAGTPADVFAQWGQSGGGTYYHKGLLREIDDLAAEAKWDLSNIPEVLQKAYSFDGKMFGVPMYSLGSFIYYNKDVFDKAGVQQPPQDWNDATWTWEEMVSRAQALTKDTDNPEKAQYGLQIGLPDLYGGVPWLFATDPFPPEAYQSGKVTTVQFNTPEMIEAIQTKQDLFQKHKVTPSASAMDLLSAAGNPLATGRVAMQFNGGWGIWELNTLENVNWGVAAMPKAKTHQIPTFSDPWYVAKGTKDAKSAFALVQYLTTGPGQKSIAVDLAAPPADQTLLSDWYGNFKQISAADLEKVYTGALQNAKETPASLLYGYAQVEDAYNQIMPAVWNGERGVAEALAEVEQRANSELKKI